MSIKYSKSMDIWLLVAYTVSCNITHSKEFSGNQGKHQNFNPAILPYKFGLIFIGMKQKKIQND